MVAEPQLVSAARDLTLEWTLADGDEAERNAAIDEQAGRVEQRRVVLLGTQVGDRPDDDLVGSQPERRRRTAARSPAAPSAMRSTSMPCTSTSARSAATPRRLARTSSVTANVAASARLVSRFAQRVAQW